MSNEKHEFFRGGKPAAERRTDDRVTSVYRPVLIETEGFAGFCLVRNLSPGGMMGSVFAEFAENQPVSVALHRDSATSGTVSWSSDGKIGIQFDQKIDVEEVLQQLSRMSHGHLINRSPRLEIECEGVLELKGRSLPIQLRDISQRGIKAEAAFLKAGDEAVVRLVGLEPRKAIVRWTQGGLAGLNFVRPLAFEQLGLWVVERQFPFTDDGSVGSENGRWTCISGSEKRPESTVSTEHDFIPTRPLAALSEDAAPESQLETEARDGKMARDSSRTRGTLRRHLRGLQEMNEPSTVMDVADAFGGEPDLSADRESRTVLSPVDDAFLVSLAEALYRARRRRSLFLPEGLFGEPGWDILLDLFIEQARGRVISTTSSCIASAVPPTTALRWIGLLEEKGLVFRRRVADDQRVHQVVLTEYGANAVRSCLAAGWDDFW